jgi:hypothetical protein
LCNCGGGSWALVHNPFPCTFLHLSLPWRLNHKKISVYCTQMVVIWVCALGSLCCVLCTLQ